MSGQILTTMETKEVRDLMLFWDHDAPTQRLVMALASSHDQLDQKYRRALWLSHGCNVNPHSDAGEMLCTGGFQPHTDAKRHRPLDFKRDTILDLETALAKLKLTESGVIFPGLNDEPIGVRP